MKRYNNAHVSDYPVLWRHLLKVARYSFSREPWQDADAQLIEANFRADDWVQRIEAPQTIHPSQTLVSVLGHATVLLRKHKLNILIDPVWASFVGPLGLLGPRRQRPMPPLSSLPKIDIVLISHDHYDHLDLQALRELCRQHNPLILTGLGVGRFIRSKIASARVVELGWWGTYVHEDHRFTFVPAQHFSGRSFWMNNTLWGGFIAESEGETFYYVGDSGYQEEIVQAIARRFPRIDLALIPIGSYEPYEYLRTYHLSPEDAVRMFAKLPVRKAFAVHFATFRLSIENAERQINDFMAARRLLEERAHDFILPVFGANYLVEGMR
jgi:L-ascorbate metabolism protein UlaG (beta-lactamase superfamily)